MGFREALKNKEVRRIFGTRELAIIEKQIFGVSLTQSEKNRLSRDIRKKFEAIKSLSPFADKFELRKGSEISELISDAKELLLNSRFYNKIKRITLYGSAFENKLSLSSDIDLAVEFYKTDAKEATIFRKELLSKVDSRVDIQVYNLMPQKIKVGIDLGGRILYERKDK